MPEQLEMLMRLVGESQQVEEMRQMFLKGPKKAILRHYDISDETYRQRFRETEKKEDKTVSELAGRLDDLLKNWTKDPKPLRRDLKIGLSEPKPKTSTEAVDMADNYVRARKQERDPELKRES
eukprot:Em0024g66a